MAFAFLKIKYDQNFDQNQKCHLVGREVIQKPTVMHTKLLISVVVLRVVNNDGDIMHPHFFLHRMTVNVVVYKVGLKRVHWLASISKGKPYTQLQDQRYPKTKTVLEWMNYNLHDHATLNILPGCTPDRIIHGAQSSRNSINTP